MIREPYKVVVAPEEARSDPIPICAIQVLSRRFNIRPVVQFFAPQDLPSSVLGRRQVALLDHARVPHGGEKGLAGNTPGREVDACRSVGGLEVHDFVRFSLHSKPPVGQLRLPELGADRLRAHLSSAQRYAAQLRRAPSVPPLRQPSGGTPSAAAACWAVPTAYPWGGEAMNLEM